MLLSGKEKYKVDLKRRINLPSWAVDEFLLEILEPNRLPKVTDLAFILTYGVNPCINVYLKNTFKKLADRINQHYGSRATTNDEERRFFLETFSGATVRCDLQGRITVPQEQLEYAKIEGEVRIVGAYERLELWNPDLFNEFMNSGTLTPQERIKLFAGVEKD